MGASNCRNFCVHQETDIPGSQVKFKFAVPQDQDTYLSKLEHQGQITPIEIVIQKPTPSPVKMASAQYITIPTDIQNLIRQSYDQHFSMEEETKSWQTIQDVCTFKVRSRKPNEAIVMLEDKSYYVGEISDDMSMTGRGILIQDDLSYYKGDFINNKAHGQGQLHYCDMVAQGSWCLGGIIRGKITKGDIKYEGDLEQGIPHGQGYLMIGNQYFYNGSFVDGLYHGQGIESDSKYIYKGGWIRGQKNGHGTVEYPDGSKYVGQWLKNKKDGKGQFVSSNGDRWIGLWSYGEPDKGKWEFKE